MCILKPSGESRCAVLSTSPSLPEREKIAFPLANLSSQSGLDTHRWRRARFLTRTCRREDQTRAKPNIRPVNIVHPCRSKWATEICHSIPTPNSVLPEGDSVTYRMPILPGLQQSLQALSAAIRTCSSPSPGRWSRTDDTGATSDGSIWNLGVRWLVPLPLAGEENMFHGTATGSPAVCCWLSEDGTRPLCISWVAGGVPVFPHVSIFLVATFLLDTCF